MERLGRGKRWISHYHTEINFRRDLRRRGRWLEVGHLSTQNSVHQWRWPTETKTTGSTYIDTVNCRREQWTLNEQTSSFWSGTPSEVILGLGATRRRTSLQSLSKVGGGTRISSSIGVIGRSNSTFSGSWTEKAKLSLMYERCEKNGKWLQKRKAKLKQEFNKEYLSDGVLCERKA